MFGVYEATKQYLAGVTDTFKSYCSRRVAWWYILAFCTSEGVKGLYKGFGPAMARSVPANAACFLAYEITRIPGSATDIKNGDLGPFDTLGDLRVTWDVILEGYKGVFNVMNCKGKGRFVLGLEGWFSEELPPPGCCSSDTVSGLVADLRLGLKVEDGRAMVEKTSAGILSIVSWRYLFVEDALSYVAANNVLKKVINP
ncbi:hypothetical protein K7X08_001564 [Anisodus acutangulus]|uniref:Uncharacterized protein n=1 Tax=Anisodus acutangulus TaxID=402998 RepID=A0A9Q1MUN3_9SOLA|nr:hypothetical protein K7X08_001564 [Anisodus acutangulus]